MDPGVHGTAVKASTGVVRAMGQERSMLMLTEVAGAQEGAEDEARGRETIPERGWKHER